ncbi:MAG: BCCT family transporter [Steroidobacteraceae bacterium]
MHEIEPGSRQSAAPRVDRTMFAIVVSAIVCICLPLGLAPEQSSKMVSWLYSGITQHFGVLYQLGCCALIVFLVGLGLSRHGSVRLGGQDARPDFSNFSWAGMLFCAGTGATLLVWAGTEWVYYYDSPPFGAQPRSPSAIEWAAAYGPFHWGVTAWFIYALPTIAIAYHFYQRRVPHLCASTGCHQLLGPRGNRSLLGRGVDTIAMLALLGGTGTSLGMIGPMISTVSAELLGVPNSFGLQMAVLAFCVALFSLSVFLGLEKGIKRLSDLNVVAALLMLLYVLAVGPTLFILKMSTDTLGFMASNFVRMMTWTDPVEATGFVEDWTIFYWAWWIAYAPVIGVFVTRISRGRTLRQVIFSMVLFGSAGCWLFYFVLGNYGLYLELQGQLPVVDIMGAEDKNVALTRMLLHLPLGSLVLALFALVSVVSVATTYDSASYTLASTVTAELRADDNPGRWHRVFWALASGVLPLFMIFVGGMDIIRLGVLAASFPVIFMGMLMAIALVRSLREDNARQ